MKFFVGVTDYDWYWTHASQAQVEEVNFWKPSPDATFKALHAGEPFLFKLHAPRNFIVGGGFFAKFLQLPVSLAWDAFGRGNGANTLSEVRERIAKYRKQPMNRQEDPRIGCIILTEPFFFPEAEWIPAPSDFSLNIVSGKGYGTDSEIGNQLWQDVTARLRQVHVTDPGPATIAAIDQPRFGAEITVMPRLGQGAFRVLVTDAYERRCAMTGERTLPVLEAAHIRPYAEGGLHELSNGLLLRSDLHTLFDKGYLTVNPDEKRILVSRRIREEFENGRDYYRLDGTPLRLPANPAHLPSTENLRFHAETKFK